MTFTPALPIITAHAKTSPSCTIWRDRPTPIDSIPADIDYIVNIDEAGNSNMKPILNAIKIGKPVDPAEKHLVLAACVFHTRDIPGIADQVMTLKRKFWPNALFSYNGTSKRICFHSREIRRQEGAFGNDVIDHRSFILDLTQLIEDLPMNMYAAHIDKVRLAHQYRWPHDPYSLSITFILERIMMNIGPNKRCIIVLESRNVVQDKQILTVINNLIDSGSQFCDTDLFSKIAGVYFNPKWCEAAHSQKSYWALEVADLCSYPLYKYLAYGTRDHAFEIVEAKLKDYPNYLRRGLKSFP